MSVSIAIDRSLIDAPEDVLAPIRRRGWRYIAADTDMLAAGAIPADLIAMIGDPRKAETLRARRDGDAMAIIGVVPAEIALASERPWFVDEWLATPVATSDIDRVAERWAPRALPAPTLRMARDLGAAAVAELLESLRHTLADTLDSPARFRDRGIAHQIGGIAGTLGFTGLGEMWRAASLGDGPPEDLLRRETRTTIVAIRRGRLAASGEDRENGAAGED